MQFFRIILGSLLNRITYSAVHAGRYCCHSRLFSPLKTHLHHRSPTKRYSHLFLLPYTLADIVITTLLAASFTYSAVLDGIVTCIAPFEGCITPSLTHEAVFSFIYSAIHIGRYCHHHPFGGTPSHVFCRPRQVLPLTFHLLKAELHHRSHEITWQYSQLRILTSSTGIVTHTVPFEGCIIFRTPTRSHLSVPLPWRLLHCIVILWWHHLLGLHHTVTLGRYHQRLWIHHTGILW